jgi:hypothetical protein
MEHRWNEIDRGKPRYSGENLSQCHFVHHKSNTDRPGIEPVPPLGYYAASNGDLLPTFRDNVSVVIFKSQDGTDTLYRNERLPLDAA